MYTNYDKEQIFTQLKSVRDSGLTNMLSFNGVQSTASDLEYYALVSFLQDNKRKYAQVLMDFTKWLNKNEW